MILIILLHFVVIIDGKDVKTPLDYCTQTLVALVNSVKNELGTVAEYADMAADIVNSVVDCELHCPDGFRRYPNIHHRPSANGCGSYGIEDYTHVMPALTECCNRHDYCYDICGIDKSVCDKDFEKCVKKLCSRTNLELSETEQANLHQACESVTTIMYSSTVVFGCPAFLKSQHKACVCILN